MFVSSYWRVYLACWDVSYHRRCQIKLKPKKCANRKLWFVNRLVKELEESFWKTNHEIIVKNLERILEDAKELRVLKLFNNFSKILKRVRKKLQNSERIVKNLLKNLVQSETIFRIIRKNFGEFWRIWKNLEWIFINPWRIFRRVCKNLDRT